MIMITVKLISYEKNKTCDIDKLLLYSAAGDKYLNNMPTARNERIRELQVAVYVIPTN
jgi:hypothetical protein